MSPLFTWILGPSCLASGLNETDPDLSNKLCQLKSSISLERRVKSLTLLKRLAGPVFLTHMDMATVRHSMAFRVIQDHNADEVGSWAIVRAGVFDQKPLRHHSVKTPLTALFTNIP